MSIDAAGTVALGDLTVPRFGYGTMRLTGPRIFGPPADRDKAKQVLRDAVDAGVRVIDTAWYYGPDVADELVAETLSPYPSDLVIVTKHGGARGEDASWFPAMSPEQLRDGVDRDLRLLGLDAIDVTHLRWMDNPDVGFAEAVDAMVALVDEGKIRRLGLSNVTVEQLDHAVAKTSIVSVSNDFSVRNRDHDDLVDRCAADGIAFLPFFPLGASPTASGAGVAGMETVAAVAARHDASTIQVALAWLLARSPTILPIPGTSSPEHVRENLAAADLTLTDEDLAELG